MLEIKELRKNYGNFCALDGLNLAVKEQEIFGFVGPNGAGKTTTMKIMAGLLRADSGEVWIKGVDALKNPDRLKDEIGYMPDFFGVYDNLTVSEYMEFYAETYGIDGFKGRQLYFKLLDIVGLSDKADFYVDGLSRGMKQRLCLARALIHDPSLVILDEPASGLDPRSRYELKETLKKLGEVGKTIIISSHVLADLSEICTGVGILEQGKMILKGSIGEISEKVKLSNPLVITVYDHLEEAVQLIRSNPLVQTLTVEGKKIIVRFHGTQREEALLLQQLTGAGILVSGFLREQGNLESIFMEITGKRRQRRVIRHEDESGI